MHILTKPVTLGAGAASSSSSAAFTVSILENQRPYRSQQRGLFAALKLALRLIWCGQSYPVTDKALLSAPESQTSIEMKWHSTFALD